MKKIFPHITIVLSLMTLTFFVIERFNEMMGFMTSRMSQWLFAAAAVFALICAVRLIAADLREEQRARERRERRARRARQEAESLAAQLDQELQGEPEADTPEQQA